MAPLVYSRSRSRAIVFVLFVVASMAQHLRASEIRVQGMRPVLGFRGRLLLEMDKLEDGEEPVPKKKPSTVAKSMSSLKNQTKSAAKVKDGLSLKNHTKSLKPSNGQSSKDQTKTSKAKLSSSNSLTSKASLDRINKPTSSQESEVKKQSKKAQMETDQVVSSKDTKKPKPKPKQQPSWMEQGNDDDIVSEFRDLPSRFQQTLIPDLEKISTTSKAYIAKANKQMTKGFKPYVGNKYAPAIASVVSCAFVLFPFLLVSLIFNRIKAYFSLQRLLIFIQIYLSIYFSILCLSSIATGLEPLRFFFATSPPTYICIQVVQTLGYVLYLLLLLMYLVLVFSTNCGLGPKFLGLAQTFVGYAVGLHYYVIVFHRMVLRQPPKTNWKVHGIYAACFLMTCLLTRAERRKKAYLDQDGSEEGKKS